MMRLSRLLRASASVLAIQAASPVSAATNTSPTYNGMTLSNCSGPMSGNAANPVTCGGSIDISYECTPAQLHSTGGVTDGGCVQATIDYAYANGITTVTCPSGTNAKLTATIYQDPISDIRTTGIPGGGQAKNMTFMAYGGSSDPGGNVGINCRFSTTVNSTYAWIMGPGRGMVLRNIDLDGPSVAGSNYRGQQNSGGIGIQVSDGASRTLIDNVSVSNFYTCEKFGGNFNGTLADSNTIFKGHINNCFIGASFPAGNADINTLYDVEIGSSTISVRGGTPVNIIGGNYSSGNTTNTFAITSVSGLTPFTDPLTHIPTWTLTANITTPDSFLTGGNVYDSFVINTTDYGVIPLNLVSYGGGVATFELYPEWIQSQYYSANILTATTIQAEIQAATQVYAAERLRVLSQGIFTVHNLWVEEDPTGSVTLIEGLGGGTASKISGLIYNNDPTASGQTTNPNFYIMQAFPFIDMPGTLGGNGLAQLDFSDFNSNQQGATTQDRVIINGSGEYEGHYHFHDNGATDLWNPNLTIQTSSFDNNGSGQAFGGSFGAWDQTLWVTGVGGTGDGTRQFGGWNYSPFHGYMPDPSATPCITPTQLTTLASLPALVTGSPVSYPLIYGGTLYRECEWTGVPAHMFVMSNHHFYSYGQQLTTSNVTSLSWHYIGGGDIVYMSPNLMARMFNGMEIQLNNGSGDVTYMVAGVYPTLGYVKTYRASNASPQSGMAGTVGTVYTGTTVEQEAYSFTTTQ